MRKNDDYLTSFKAAEILGFTADYIRRLIVKGKIKAVKMGNNYLIKPKDIVGITRQRQRRQGIEHGSNQ